MGMDSGKPLRIGVSTCLLGENVRFDSGHRHDRFVTDLLGRYVEFVPVCPEVEIGLGIPREPIHLARDGDRLRLLGVKSGADHTEAMQAFAAARAEALAALDLSGYVLKKDSPSCGLFRVKVYRDGAPPTRDGRGLFAAALADRLAPLPIEEEGRLNDPRLRETFVECLFAYRRLTDLLQVDWTVGDLVAFHSNEKLLLMAHEPAAYKALGRLVAEAKGRDQTALAAAYRDGFMAAMAKPATPARHANALQHMAGYFRKHLDPGSKAELAGLIEDFRTGLVPLIVPITLIRHHVRRLDIAYLAGQTYLAPHPKELMLRNHV